MPPSPHMAEEKQDDQHEHIYSSSVSILDIALKTCQWLWTIGRSGERGSGIFVLAARHDDEEVVKISADKYIWYLLRVAKSGIKQEKLIRKLCFSNLIYLLLDHSNLYIKKDWTIYSSVLFNEMGLPLSSHETRLKYKCQSSFLSSWSTCLSFAASFYHSVCLYLF